MSMGPGPNDIIGLNKTGPDGSSDGGAHGSGLNSGSLVKESSLETFAADVIEASMSVPVVVDFWADWCGPCKQLTPLLEKLTQQGQGAFKLVKVNVDQNRELAAQLRIQSLPTVMAFKNGQPVDGFAGALPESQLKQFLKNLTGEQGPSPIDQMLEQAKAAYDAKDLASAAQMFGAVVQQDPSHAEALAGLARCYLDSGDTERAKQTLALVSPEDRTRADVAGVQSALDLAQESNVPESEVSALRDRLDQNPDDHQARFDLAMAANAKGDRDTAVSELLEIVRRDRGWNEDGARAQLIKLFEAYGPKDPATLSGRRRLSSLLFS